MRSTRTEITAVVTSFFVLLCAFFWPAVFGGKVLMAGGFLFELDPLWKGFDPQLSDGPRNLLISDLIRQMYPWRLFAFEALKAGELPLWNPYNSAGQAFLANGQSGLFDPIQLIGLAFGLNNSFVVVAILRLLIAGSFTYLFARASKMSVEAALFSGLSFMFSTPIIVWLGYPLMSVIVWLPALLYSGLKFTQTKRPRYFVMAVVFTAFQFFGGHPQSSVIILSGWGVYSLFILWPRKRAEVWPAIKNLSLLFLIVILGASLAAAQLIPYGETVLNGATYYIRSVISTIQTADFFGSVFFLHHAWPGLIVLLLPLFYGTPITRSYWFDASISNFNEQSVYVGALTLALLPVAFIYAVKNLNYSPSRQIIFWSALGTCALGFSFALPGFAIINHLPVFDVSNNARFRLLLVLCFAMVGGYAIDILKNDRRQLAWVIRCSSLLALMALALTAYGYFYQHALNPKSARVFSPDNWRMLIPVFTFLALLFLSRLQLTNRRTATCLVFVLLADLLSISYGYNSVTRRELLYPESPIVSAIKEDKSVFRIAAEDQTFSPNTSSAFGIQDLRGYDPGVSLSFYQFMSQVEGVETPFHQTLVNEFDDPKLDLLNVKYAVTKQQLSGKWNLLLKQKNGVKLYENRDVLPRARAVSKYEVIADTDRTLARLSDPSFDFRSTVIVDHAPNLRLSQTALPVTANIRFLSYSLNRLAIEVDASSNSLLVLTDNYAPGWSAYVNEERTEILRANHTFRAVVVPEGKSTVSFVYQPESFRWGVIISILSMLVLIFLSRVLKQCSLST